MTSCPIVYVAGGRARRTDSPLQEWEWFDEARVLRVDCTTGEVECVIRHETPPEARPDETPSIVFKAGSRQGHRLFLCTQTEVLEYDLRDRSLKRSISLPFFNDLHHVQILANGNLAVVVTGLDLVVEITPEGEVVQEWAVLDEAPFARFSRKTDYRKISTTKPHHAHPNYSFELDGSLWATRFHQRDAIRLDSPADRFAIGKEPPHDGHVMSGSVYFTTVKGDVVVLDAETRGRKRRDIYKVADMAKLNAPLGWCRGLKLLGDGSTALVGFTRLRKTRIQRNLAWVKAQVRRGMQLRMPRFELVSAGTMIVLVDLEAGEILRHIDLEPYGLNAVFSIHADPDAE